MKEIENNVFNLKETLVIKINFNILIIQDSTNIPINSATEKLEALFH